MCHGALQVLDLSRNCVRRLPPWLCRRLAPSLEVLCLHANKLEAVPPDVKTLTQLQVRPGGVRTT